MVNNRSGSGERHRRGAASRLLFVVNDAAFFLSHRLPLAAAAISKGFDVHVAAPEGCATTAIMDEGLSYHPIPLTRKGVNPWQELGSLIALVSLYRKLKPDIVHHVTVKPVIYGGIAARLAGVPAVVNAVSGLGYVFIAKGFKAELLRAVVKLGYRIAFSNMNQRIIFQNPEDIATFLKAGITVMQDTVLIKGSGVDTLLFTPQPEPEGIPLVILASRMLWDKGVGEFVEAAKTLRSEGIAIRFALIGDTDFGNPAAVPMEQLREWHNSGAVECWGRRADMPIIFAGANVVCLPSYREGLPKVLIEAAACGRAIVTTDAPGCREIVRHGENGLLVPVRDSKALVEALRTLIEDPALRARMGALGREIAVVEFSEEHVIKETLSVYRELLKEKWPE
ncbi:MAG: glycosyltransferase family 4 protein [Candidatus Methanoperedens sp.]|nr:glycosyltransferase family 4 protein [Candidatus Methanoperedens sp.]